MSTFCVDLDGVLAEYHGWDGPEPGDPIPGAVQFTHDLKRMGKVIIHTCRCSPDMAGSLDKADKVRRIIERWLVKHDFSYDSVWQGIGKPVAIAYIDDRAITCSPQSPRTVDHPEMEFIYALGHAKDLMELRRDHN